MKRRLRKKKHLGEFKKIAFGIIYSLKNENEYALDEFIDKVDELKTLCSGSYNPKDKTLNMIVEQGLSSNAENAEKIKTIIIEYVKSIPTIDSVKVTESFDIWYESDLDTIFENAKEI